MLVNLDSLGFIDEEIKGNFDREAFLSSVNFFRKEITFVDY
jgi:hypothetical protein